MSSKTIWNTLIVSSFVSAAVAGGNPTLILDDFDADPNDDAGGPREVSTVVLSNPDPFGGSERFEIVTDSVFAGDIGSAVFESGTGVRLRGEILWNNNGAGLSLDAASLGLTGFELDFAAVDKDFEISISLGDGSGNFAFQNFLISSLELTNSVRTDSFSLADFDLTGFDATDVDSVEITFNRRTGIREGVDFAVTEFRAVVPTPGSIAILGLGGLLAARRRR